MTFMFVLGREPKISLAELEALFSSDKVTPVASNLALVESDTMIDLDRIGGSIKVGQILDLSLVDYLSQLPAGKITLGFSDYTPKATTKQTWQLAMKYKSLLTRHGRSVRLVPNNETPTLSSATSHHNQLGEKLNHIEIIKYKDHWATSIGTQNITAYAKRDQARPARDAFVGMLPPKLAQILINLATCGAPTGHLLDPFCGTGVVLQEALLLNYSVYGTDISDKMVDYSKRNLNWLIASDHQLDDSASAKLKLAVGDATTFRWQKPINFVVSEIYLGHPLSSPPSEAKLFDFKSDAKHLLKGFLKNLAPQLSAGTPVVLATPAWLRPDGSYSSVDILDEIAELGYNTTKYRYAAPSDLLYYRENQIVARQIIVLRKK